MRNSEEKGFNGLELVLHKLELQAHAAIGAVIERAELLRVQVVLHVARVPVVRDIEDRQARASFVFLAAKRDRETFRYEHIERHQLRKAAARVTWSHKVLLLVQQRKRKAAVPVERRRRDDIKRQTEVAPE